MNTSPEDNQPEGDSENEIPHVPIDVDKNQTIIKGDAKTHSGDFVGRDKHTDGDAVDGDKIAGDKIINHFHQLKARLARITVTIEGDFASFSKKDQKRIQRIIAEMLHMNESVTILRVDPGIIKITLELPLEKAEELYDLVKYSVY